MPPRFYLLTDTKRLPDWRKVLPLLPQGAGVILRDYDAPDRAALASEMARLCRRLHLHFLIGGDAALARKHKAGLHMPENMATPFLAAQCPHGQTLSMAAHSPAALRKAHALNVDAVLLSPVFATPSHPHAKPANLLGVVRLAALSRQTRLPLIALGGMTARRFARLSGARLHGFAAIGFWAGLAQ